jgi:hypothetical protein
LLRSVSDPRRDPNEFRVLVVDSGEVSMLDTRALVGVTGEGTSVLVGETDETSTTTPSTGKFTSVTVPRSIRGHGVFGQLE